MSSTLINIRIGTVHFEYNTDHSWSVGCNLYWGRFKWLKSPAAVYDFFGWSKDEQTY